MSAEKTAMGLDSLRHNRCSNQECHEESQTLQVSSPGEDPNSQLKFLLCGLPLPIIKSKNPKCNNHKSGTIWTGKMGQHREEDEHSRVHRAERSRKKKSRSSLYITYTGQHSEKFSP